MAISSGYSKYVDDRDHSIVEMIADTDTEAKNRWHQVSRIDANQVPKTYLFCEESYAGFTALIERHDAEFRAWMEGVE